MIDVSNFVRTLGGKPVAVFGLGLSNRAVLAALRAAGAEAVAGDDKPALPSDLATADFLKEDFSRFACLVLAPGVPLHFPAPHPVVEKARAAGIEIICDIEILHRCRHGRTVIGITGTNGKSTTTALTGHVLNACGIRAAVGGNIGTPVLALDLPLDAFVIELSSYQLDLCPTFKPDIAVLLNITPDHIDRHGSLAGYVESKKRIFGKGKRAVIAVDDDITRAIADEMKDAVRVSAAAPEFDAAGLETLRGAHNHQNAAAAWAAGRLMGLGGEAIYKAMKSFPGLPHRQFPVAARGRVTYINDSKATNADAAGKALASFDNIYWIIGGRPKEGGLAGLEPFMGRIRRAYAIGEAMDEFAAWLAARKVECVKSGTLEKAVRQAHDDAQQAKGEAVVLLSPACASLDQFRNFEHRGDEFARIVKTLTLQEAC